MGRALAAPAHRPPPGRRSAPRAGQDRRHAGQPDPALPLPDRPGDPRPAAGGRRRLLLVDEADALVRVGRERGYPLFSRFRALAEEDRCHAILAGFWDLYAAAALDYQAPIKNFGEVLPLGALEEEACRQLATRPMETLGLSWADPAALERLIRGTGGRANLASGDGKGLTGNPTARGGGR